MSDLPAASAAAWAPSQPDWGQLLTDPLDCANAAAHWRRIGEELRLAGRWTPANDHAVMRLVLAYVIYDREARLVMEDGAVIPSPKTKVPQFSLHFVAMNSAADTAAKLEAELMIAPRKRGKTPMRNAKAGESAGGKLDL